MIRKRESRGLPTERDRQIGLAVLRHGQMTLEQVRQLFFRRSGDSQASPQAVGRRLRLLVERGYLGRVRLTAARGSGPFVYLPGPAAGDLVSPEERALFPGLGKAKANSASLRHGLETVDIYIAVQRALEEHGGSIETWLGEAEARCRFLWHGRRLTLTPDAYCFWIHAATEGSLFLELDRGTESLQRLAQKLARYGEYFSCRAYIEHLGGMGLKPRILFVVPGMRRRERIVRWLAVRRGTPPEAALPTVLVAVQSEVMVDALGAIWYRAGQAEPMRFVD